MTSMQWRQIAGKLLSPLKATGEAIFTNQRIRESDRHFINSILHAAIHNPCSNQFR